MRLLSIFLLLFISAQVTRGQTLFPEVYSCFGGDAKNASVQLTWTAGEPLYTTVQNTNNVLTQGFNQTVYVSAVLMGLPEVDGYNISAYPNPTRGILNLRLQTENQQALDLQITDMFGRTLLSTKSTSDLEQLDISQFSVGLYLLRISNGKQIVKIFKIEKTQ